MRASNLYAPTLRNTNEIDAILEERKNNASK